MNTSIVSFRAAALAELEKAGVTLHTGPVRQWVTEQYSAGVKPEELLALWRSSANSDNVRAVAGSNRIEFVTRELERRVVRIQEGMDELAKKLKNANASTVAGLAAEHAEKLIGCTVKQRVFAHYSLALENAKLRGEDDCETFARLSLYAYRELASKAASAESQSTSWQTNAETRAHLAALGEIAGYFLDIAKISPR